MTPDDKATIPLPAAPAAPDAERATVPLPGPQDTTAPLLPEPDTIGRFVVRGWLGSGAFGDVYRCHDPHLDREVALKVAKPGSLTTPERLARFLREAKAAANLRHPNIVPLFETGTDGDRRFIASAFIDGRTLEAVVQEANDSGTPLPLLQVAEIGRKLADALAYAHAQGIAHRDVKPANVLLDAAGEPHLLDFGLAARQEAGAEKLTHDAQGLGTPAYMAPEQAAGSGDAASDQYALGCTLYELATGRTPFAGGPPQQIFLHQTQPPPSPRSVRTDIPKDLDTLLLRCLDKEPTRRYPNCSELADDLRRFVSGEPVKVRRAGPLERTLRWTKRNKRLAGMGLLVLLTMALGTGFSLGFGLYANEQRKTADARTVDAEREKKNAEESAAGEKREKVAAQRALTRSLLAAMTFGSQYDPLTSSERDALWDIATLRDEPVGLDVFAQAVRTPMADQFHCRGQFLHHAVVGLDARRRGQADRLLADALTDQNFAHDHRLRLADSAVAAVIGPPDTTAEVLLSMLARSTDEKERSNVAFMLNVTASRLSAERATDVRSTAIRAVGLAPALGTLAQYLPDSAALLPASRAVKEAEAAVVPLLRAIEAKVDGTQAAGLRRVCQLLPPERSVEVLHDGLKVCTDDYDRGTLAGGLRDVAARLPAERAVRMLTAALAGAKAAGERGVLVDGLAAVADRLPAAAASEARRTAVETVVSALRATTDEGGREDLSEWLASVAVRLPAADAVPLLAAAQASAPVTAGRLTRNGLLPSFGERHMLAVGLNLVVRRLPAGEAAAALRTAFDKATVPVERWGLARGVAEVAGRLPAGEAGKLCGHVADVLTSGIDTETDETDRVTLTAGLSAVARQIPAGGGCDRLLAVLRKRPVPAARGDIPRGLAVAAGRLPAGEREKVCRAAVEVLSAALTAAAEGDRDSLARGLAAVADGLPADAVVALLRPALRKATVPAESGALAVGLASAPELVRSEVASELLEPAGKKFSFTSLEELAQGLCAVTCGLDEPEREQHQIVPALAGGGVVRSAPLPTPRPLSPQELVEFLKHPFCLNQAQRAVLDALEFTYDRKFADLWEFVAFAETEHPELDLLTPPKRPEKVLPKVDGKPK